MLAEDGDRVKKLLLAAALLVMFLIPQHVQALSCVKKLTIEESYEWYDGIVIGKVEELTPGTQNNELKLKVSKSYKGVEEAYLVIDEDSTWGAIWGPSVVGEEYLFFLTESDGQWTNPLCSPSLKASAAGSELKFLADKEISIVKEEVTEHSSAASDSSTSMWDAAGNWLFFVIAKLLLLLSWR